MLKIPLPYYIFFSKINIFPEKPIEIKYKNIHLWMPKSLLNSIVKHHILYKLSITTPTEENKLTYKTYNNKLNAIKQKSRTRLF